MWTENGEIKIKLGCAGQVCQTVKFELEVRNVLETRFHEISDEEKGAGYKKWLGWKGLLLMETFM